MSGSLQSCARPIVGVDLDNTIVSYDLLMYRKARDRGLINGNVNAAKREVRDAVRDLSNGEIQWQMLQGVAYGPSMGEATLIIGVMEFFRLCKEQNIPVHIVSHKTEYAPYDETRTDLRAAALAWMTSHGLFEHKVTGLRQESVSFAPTRKQKIERIRQLGCTHFIDDLEETFLEDSFPDDVEKILFSPNPQKLVLQGATVLTSWKEIQVHFF